MTPGRRRAGADRMARDCGASCPISCAPSCRSRRRCHRAGGGGGTRRLHLHELLAEPGGAGHARAPCGGTRPQPRFAPRARAPARRDEAQGAEATRRGASCKSGVEALLATKGAPAAPSRVPAEADAWGTALPAKLAALPADAAGAAQRAAGAGGQGRQDAKPAKGWLKSAEQALDRPDRAQLGEHLLDLIECHDRATSIALENQETVRGLIWLAALAAPEAAARRLEAFAQTCLTFSAGALRLSLAGAGQRLDPCVLADARHGAALASLSRLRRRLKRPGEIKTVDKALTALARRAA